MKGYANDMELPERKSNRLIGYDYSINGAYFITICTKNRSMLLGDVEARSARLQNKIALSVYGNVVDETIKRIPFHYPCVSVDKYCLMPNHVHLILRLSSNDSGRAMRAPTIATVINQMKGYVTKQIGFSLWQKLYYDHVIRNEKEYLKIWEYIDQNYLLWEDDRFFKEPEP
jgi:REP element-mobilizing transposase RayT